MQTTFRTAITSSESDDYSGKRAAFSSSGSASPLARYDTVR